MFIWLVLFVLLSRLRDSWRGVFLFLVRAVNITEALSIHSQKWDCTLLSSVSAIWTAPASGRKSRHMKRSWTKLTGLSKSCTRMEKTSSMQLSVSVYFDFYHLNPVSCKEGKISLLHLHWSLDLSSLFQFVNDCCLHGVSELKWEKIACFRVEIDELAAY